MKTLIKFEKKLIAVGQILFIEPKDVWNNDKGEFEYQIVFNDNERFESISMMPQFVFSFLNREYRDKKLEILEMLLTNFDHIEILTI